jgi:hypothetical protein
MDPWLVRTAHGDAWQVEGRARCAAGGDVLEVRGARAMASGIPAARWNNADVTSADVDLEALDDWYARRGAAWGIRVPLGLDVRAGREIGSKRSFATDRAPAERAAPRGVTVRRARAEDLDALVAAEERIFGDPGTVARAWIAPVLGVPGFTHWVAERGDAAVAVATVVASDGLAGPAAMLTGVGTRTDEADAWAATTAAAIRGALAAGARIAHAHDMGGDAGRWRALGLREVPGFVVRVIRAEAAGAATGERMLSRGSVAHPCAGYAYG